MSTPVYGLAALPVIDRAAMIDYRCRRGRYNLSPRRAFPCAVAHASLILHLLKIRLFKGGVRELGRCILCAQHALAHDANSRTGFFGAV